MDILLSKYGLIFTEFGSIDRGSASGLVFTEFESNDLGSASVNTVKFS